MSVDLFERPLTVPILPITPSFRLDGRRALITGAGRGIGAAAAAALSDAGAAVTLVSRSAPELEAVANALRERGGQAQSLVLNVTESKAVADALFERGPFDILVNSAGTNRPALLTDTSDADMDAVFDLNVRATFSVCREVARGWRDALEDHRLWAELDLSVASGIRRTAALLRGFSLGTRAPRHPGEYPLPDLH